VSSRPVQADASTADFGFGREVFDSDILKVFRRNLSPAIGEIQLEHRAAARLTAFETSGAVLPSPSGDLKFGKYQA
jgi:hypothetical protein